VQSAKINCDEFNDPKFEKCLINEAKNCLVPPIMSGVTNVAYPFTFSD
jgi:hypothetical protein